ncbi:hypothetical protein Tco_1493102 [Tanacetum coccineum]
MLTQADFEGQAYEVVKAFYPNVIHLQFQMEEYLEYLRYGNKGSRPALSISMMKVASYHDFGLELLVPEQMWIDKVCTYDISTAYGISHWSFNRQKYDYLSEIVLQRADCQEHKIAEKDFKNMYPSDFEDLNLFLLQGHLDHLPGSNKQYPSDTYVFIMKMEIPLEPTSNKLMVGKLGDSDVHALDDPTLILEILSRRFFLRLNLPDHRTMNNQAFTIKKGMSMPVQMSQAQNGERPQVNDQRLDLADDLKEAQDHISSTIISHKTKFTTSKYKILREESKTMS